MKCRVLLIGSFALITVFVLFSCKKDKNVELQSEKLNFETFDKLGEMHNNFMTNVKDNFWGEENLKTTDAKIDYIAEFHRNFLSISNLPEADTKSFFNNLDRSKNLTEGAAIRHLLTEKKTTNEYPEEPTLYETLDLAYNYNLIDEFEYHSLINLTDILSLCIDGKVSQVELESYLTRMKSEWISKGYTVDSGYGFISGSTIAISNSSINWWEENADQGLEATKSAQFLVPVWAASDAVGALWGAATGAVGSYVNNGEVNWGSVGWGALSGAVAGSTGVVGKVAKWLMP